MEVQNLNAWLEWSGAIIGLFGAGLLATYSRAAKFSWVCFLVANVSFIVWAIRIEAHGLLVQQLGFMLTSLLGVVRSGVFPSFYVKKNEIEPGGHPR